MKILLLPDLHCFYTIYGSTDPSTGKNTRYLEWQKGAFSLVEAARIRGVELALAPGDFFPNARPEPDQYKAVARLFQAFEAANISVVGCMGNHDLPQAEFASPCEIVAAMGKANWAVTKPSVVTAKGVQIAVLPSRRFQSLVADSKNIRETSVAAARALEKTAEDLFSDCTGSGPRVLMAHWAVAGGAASSGQILDFEKEPVLDLQRLVDMGWTAVCLGHLHKPQVLCEAPFVGYSGTVQRVDYGEAMDPRGAWVLDLDTMEREWVDLPVFSLRTIRMDEKKMARLAEEPDFIEELLPEESLEGEIVRVCYVATEDVASRVDGGLIQKALAQRGAHVTSITGEIARPDRSRLEGVTESTGPLEALGQWLGLRQEMEGAFRQCVLDKAASLMGMEAN